MFAAIVLVMAAPSVAAAQTVVPEVGDAGNVPSTAQVIPGEVETITGSGCPRSRGPVSRLPRGRRDVLRHDRRHRDRDTQLFLFDATGRGVVGNDDNAEGLQSTLPAGLELTPTTGGIYYLGVSFFDDDPLSAAGPVLEGEVIIDDVRYYVPQPPGGDHP